MFLTLKSLLISNKNLLFILLLFWFLILLSLLLVYLWPGSWHFCTKCALVLTGLIFYSALLLLCNSKPRPTDPSPKESTLVPYKQQTVPISDNLAFAKLFPYGVAINKGEESLRLFVKKCKLTNKEEEVMRLLLCSDACIRDLSHDLMVSERVCQRHLTSIYEKTGTKSRLALLMKYYE